MAQSNFLSQNEAVQRATAHLIAENAALIARLEMGPQIKVDPQADLKKQLRKAQRALSLLSRQASRTVEQLREARLYELADPLRDAVLEADK